MISRNWPYLLAAVLALAAVASLAIDVPVARYALSNSWPGDLRKLLDVSEIFAHGLGVLLILATVATLDTPNLPRLPRVAACAYGAGSIAQISKHLLPRIRPNEFDYSGDVFSSFLGFLAVGQRELTGLTARAIQSFPSGHSATAVGLAFGLAWLYPRGRWLFTLFAVLAAAQRIESSAHFVSDTFAGAAMACVIAGFCIDERFLGQWFTRLEHAQSKRASL